MKNLTIIQQVSNLLISHIKDHGWRITVTKYNKEKSEIPTELPEGSTETQSEQTPLENGRDWFVLHNSHCSAAQLCPTLCSPMDGSTPGFPVLHYLPEFAQTQGFPGGTRGEEHAYQCRRQKRRGFHPWFGKTPWRRKWQLTPVFLPGRSHGTGKPGGL